MTAYDLWLAAYSSPLIDTLDKLSDEQQGFCDLSLIFDMNDICRNHNSTYTDLVTAMRHKYTFWGCLFFLLPVCLLAQNPRVVFGKVSEEDIYMDRYEADPSAPAVILMDQGEVHFSEEGGRLRAVYRYYRRIKILKEEGLRWAKVILSYNRVDGESIANIKGRTYFVGEDGEIESLKLDRKVIVDEKLDKSSNRKVFPLPGVRVGSVIEYSYQVSTSNIQQLKTWYFQTDIPVAYSDFHSYIPDFLTYQLVLKGDLSKLQTKVDNYTVQGAEVRVPAFTQGDVSPMFSIYNFSSKAQTGRFARYSLEDVSVLKDEPFTTRVSDHRAAISFLLIRNLKPRLAERKRVVSWKDLNRSLLTHEDFGDRMEDRSVQNKGAQMGFKVRQIKERARIVFEYIRDRMEWNGRYSVWVEQDLGLALSRKKGNSAEINLLLLNMLKGAKIEAYPVLISTRDNGKIVVTQPDLSQFNHVVVVAKLRSEIVLLDALSQSAPFGMLPRIDLNEIGFLVDDDDWGWLDVEPTHEMIRNTYSRLEMDQQGQLTGDLEFYFTGYRAAIERGKLEAYRNNASQYVEKELLNGLGNTVLGDVSVRRQKEIEKPLNVECKIQSADFVQKADGFLFVRPMLTNMIEENPFQAEERQTPVDLACPIREYYLLGLEIPEGYEVVQTPQPIRVLLPAGAGSFTYNVLTDGRIVHISSTIFIEKTTFQPHEYQEIRSFFEYVTRKHEEDIILKRSES